MSFEPRDYLRHIQVEIDYLITESDGVALEHFLVGLHVVVAVLLAVFDDVLGIH